MSEDFEIENKISYGTFKTMNLHKSLVKNIKHTRTTPIQRKIIPLLSEGVNVTGIARTGSGKTFAYLVPLIDNILKNKNLYISNDESNSDILEIKLLVLVPTRELAIQVSKVASSLIKSTDLVLQSIHGGTSIQKDFSNMLDKKIDICVATVGRLRHCIDEMKKKINARFLVIDEMDRIYEEPSMKNDLELLIEEEMKITYSNLSLFSATLPEKIIPLVNRTRLIKIDAEMSESLKNYYFFINRDNKEKSLLILLDKISSTASLSSKKTIIFGSTRHTIELLSDILNKVNIKHKMLYSSMDQQAREQNLEIFSKGKVPIILSTDLAARGLDIKDLDICINYDMTDEKTFLHRVGRVARNGRTGESFSFVAFNELNYFYNLKDTYFNRTEEFFLGLIPQDLLDMKKIEIDKNLKKVADNGNKKMEGFRKKIGKTNCKENLLELKVHEYFLKDNLDDKTKNNDSEKKKNELLIKIRKYRNINLGPKYIIKEKNNGEEKDEISLLKKQVNYKDQFYIPYTNKENKSSLHFSAYSVPNDEKKINEKERKKKVVGLLFKEWEKKKKRIGSGNFGSKNSEPNDEYGGKNIYKKHKKNKK